MDPCPHCGAAIPVCPTCGKSLSDHAPHAATNKRPDRYDGDHRLESLSQAAAPDLDLQLEVELRPGLGAPALSSASVPSSGGLAAEKPISLRVAAAGGTASGGSLAIKPMSSGHAASGVPVSTKEPAIAKAAVGVGAVPETRSILDVKAPVIDAAEAKITGRFGKPPDKLWELPAYSSMVRARIAEIEVTIEAKDVALKKAEEALAETLVKIARKAAQVVPTLSRVAKQPYMATLETLRAAEEALADAQGAQAAESTARAEKLRSIDRRIAEFSREYDAAWEDQRQAGDRASPEVKRVVEEARTKLQAAKDERDAVVAQSSPAGKTPGSEKAWGELCEVAARFSEHVIQDEINFGKEFHPLRDEVVRNVRGVESARREVALYRAALATHDSAAVTKGQLVVKGAIGGGVAFLILLLVIVLLK